MTSLPSSEISGKSLMSDGPIEAESKNTVSSSSISSIAPDSSSRDTSSSSAVLKFEDCAAHCRTMSAASTGVPSDQVAESAKVYLTCSGSSDTCSTVPRSPSCTSRLSS